MNKLQELETKINELRTKTVQEIMGGYLDKLQREFDELKAGANVMPEEDSTYWYIDNIGVICNDIWTDHEYDLYRYYTGNYYSTYEEAEKALAMKHVEIEYMKLVQRINAEPECPKVFPDWEDDDQSKYYPKFDYDNTKEYIKSCIWTKVVETRFYAWRKPTYTELNSIDGLSEWLRDK